jgi:hypothetical protein
MALVKFSALVSEIVGRMGHSIFQNSRSGTVLHPMHTNLNSSRSNNYRQQSNVAQIQAAWQALTPAERQLWEVYAQFRNRPTRKMSGLFLRGQDTFVLENSIRLIFNAAGGALAPAILIAPVITPPPGQIAFTNITNTAGVLSYNTDQSFNPAENFYMIYISRPLLGSQMSGWNKQKLICKPNAAGNYQVITSQYLALWAVIPNTGQYVNTEIFNYSILTNTFGASTKQRIQIS